MTPPTLYLFASKWCSEQNKPFTAEHLREAFLNAGGEPPRNPNDWGALFTRLQWEGVIKHNGFCRAKRKEANGRAIGIWISIPYREKQRLNAMNNGRSQLTIFNAGA